MLRGDGNENGNKKKKSIGPIKSGPPIPGLREVVDVCTY